MLLVIIIVVLICVIKFRAAKTKGPPDGGCTENSEGKTILIILVNKTDLRNTGIDSTNTKMSINECYVPNVSMDSNLAYGIRDDMVSSTHFTPALQRQEPGGQNIPGSHGYEGSESPEHVYATVKEELNITHTFQTGEDYDDVIP